MNDRQKLGFVLPTHLVVHRTLDGKAQIVSLEEAEPFFSPQVSVENGRNTEVRYLVVL